MPKSAMRFRPFSEAARVRCRGYSRKLQRVICDFGADHAFGQIGDKIVEHYGIEVPISSSQKITESHASQFGKYLEEQPASCANAEIVIAEIDGCMLPLVETYAKNEQDQEVADKRKNKRLFWKEARLSLAHKKGSVTPYFAATLGSAENAGKQLMSCVRHAGGNYSSKVHCVGDGASWIADQVEERFGANGNYLIDFYHLCEYLSAAASTCAPENKESWMKAQKASMKANNFNLVLSALRPYIEKKEIAVSDVPVRACYRYISNRTEQLDYKHALENDLPIGSGEIESAHRYVLQKRLKIAGAWWKKENAQNMMDLRVCRANGLWNSYWRKAA